MIGVLCSEEAVSSTVATLRDGIYDEKRGEGNRFKWGENRT